MPETRLRANASKVRQLREQRGWSQEDLANKAGCAKRTVENVEAGQSILRRTLMEIEDALGVERWALQQADQTLSDMDVTEETGEHKALDKGASDSEEPGNVIVAESVATIDLVINRDFDSFSKEEEQHLLEAIKQLFLAGNDIRVIGKRRGSVILTLEMTPEQAERLYWAVKAGKLSRLNVTDARLTGLDDQRDDGLDADLDGLDERPMIHFAQAMEWPSFTRPSFTRQGINLFLLVVQGRPEGKRLSFPRGQYLFGRGSDCHIRFNSDWVSQRHCQLFVGSDDVRIRDLGSRNGTLVNGERIVGERFLNQGDQVQVGPLVFQICLDNPVHKPDTPPVSARPKPGDTQAHCLDTQFSLDTVGRSSISDAMGSRAPESAAREPDTQSSIDPLTGLLSREAIDDLARLQLRAGRRLALGLIDLDRFRAINLRYSHLGGDAVLIAVARILNSVLPAGSSVGRLGCEHFLVLAPEATVEEVAMLAERIRSAVQQERFAYKDQVIEATVSIGFAVAEAGVAAEYHQMRGVAAAALAEAKSAGRNRGVV
jgi:diguanylate cyclase (GGDEF)-like protein